MDDKTKRAIAEMENVSASSRIDDEHEALVRRVVALLEAPGCPDDVGLLAHSLVDKALQLGRAEAKREIDNERAYRSIAEGALDKAAARVAELEVSASAWREFRRLVHNTMEAVGGVVMVAVLLAAFVGALVFAEEKQAACTVWQARVEVEGLSAVLGDRPAGCRMPEDDR